MHLAELTTKYTKVSSLKEAQIGWEDDYETSSKQVCILATGCLLPKVPPQWQFIIYEHYPYKSIHVLLACPNVVPSLYIQFPTICAAYYSATIHGLVTVNCSSLCFGISFQSFF